MPQGATRTSSSGSEDPLERPRRAQRHPDSVLNEPELLPPTRGDSARFGGVHGEDMMLEEVLGMGMRVSSARYSEDGKEGGGLGSSRRGSLEPQAVPVGGKPVGKPAPVRGSDPKETGTASRRHATTDKLRTSVSGGSSREARNFPFRPTPPQHPSSIFSGASCNHLSIWCDTYPTRCRVAVLH